MKILPALLRKLGLHLRIPRIQLGHRHEFLLPPLVNDSHQHGERIIFSRVEHLPCPEGLECMRQFPVHQRLKGTVGAPRLNSRALITSSVDTGCGWAMSQPCTAKVVLGTPQCAPAATQRFENSSSHWVFVFSVEIFDKLSIFCESRESFGMNLIGNRLTVSEQCLNGPTSDGGSNGHTPGAPPHTRVVIRMGLGYHAEDGPAIKARRPKPRSVFQAFHVLCRGSGIRSSLHQRGGDSSRQTGS